MSGRRGPNLLDQSTYPEPERFLNTRDPDRAHDFYLDTMAVGPEIRTEATEGHLGNTAPTTLHTEPGDDATEPEEYGGFDTLEILLHGEWEQERFDRLARQLDQAQQQARGVGNGKETLTRIGGEEVMVWSSGVRRGVYCSWCFTWQGMDFALVNRLKSDGEHFGIHLRIGSIACMELGGPSCWNRAKYLFAALGFRVNGNKATRSDMCVDLPGVSTHEMATEYSQFKFIARGRSSQEYTECYRRTGFRRGSPRRIMVRCYDKLRELGDSKEDCFKEDILTEKRWGGVRPKEATRVEFQLRREALKDFSVDSVENLFEKAGEICTWLTHKRFRMTDQVPDRNHTDRAETSEVWQKVQRYFAETFGEWNPDQVERKPRRVMTVDPAPLRKQTLGCLTSLAACMGRLVQTPAELATFTMEMVHAGGFGLVQEVANKRADIETWLSGLQAARPIPRALDQTGDNPFANGFGDLAHTFASSEDDALGDQFSRMDIAQDECFSTTSRQGKSCCRRYWHIAHTR